MKQTGHLKRHEGLIAKDVREMLEDKFTSINYEQAKQDVMPFVKDPLALNLWSSGFFNSITRDKLMFYNPLTRRLQ